ncbi:MAG: hypothetical protein ACXQTR_06360 [Candidatus Methanospirareceae archaeon]
MHNKVWDTQSQTHVKIITTLCAAELRLWNRVLRAESDGLQLNSKLKEKTCGK